MRLPSKQAHVLANIERVELRPFKVVVPSSSNRYQLDGEDCTSQIAGLCERKLVAKRPDGRVARLAGSLREYARLRA